MTSFSFMVDVAAGLHAARHVLSSGNPELIALHVVSDSVIALAYYSIPVALVYFVLKRTDFAFSSDFRTDRSLHSCLRRDAPR